MGIDERGRWRADPNEPFNAGLDGIDPETVRRLGSPTNDGCGSVAMWIAGVVLVLLGWWGPSLAVACMGAGVLVLAALWTRSRRRHR